MAKEKVGNQYHTKADIEKFLKSDKKFMTTRSAAEFDAWVEGAVWMANTKQIYIDKLVERSAQAQKKIIELTNELAPYRELYENYDMVEKRSKKLKKKSIITEEVDDEDDDSLELVNDVYPDLSDDDFE